MLKRQLTDREREVIVRRVRGEPVKDIAADLGLGISTVAEYQSRALVWLEVATLQAVLDALAVSEKISTLFRQTGADDAVTLVPVQESPEELRDLVIIRDTAAEAIARRIAKRPRR